MHIRYVVRTWLRKIAWYRPAPLPLAIFYTLLALAFGFITWVYVSAASEEPRVLPFCVGFAISTVILLGVADWHIRLSRFYLKMRPLGSHARSKSGSDHQHTAARH